MKSKIKRLLAQNKRLFYVSAFDSLSDLVRNETDIENATAIRQMAAVLENLARTKEKELAERKDAE